MSWYGLNVIYAFLFFVYKKPDTILLVDVNYVSISCFYKNHNNYEKLKLGLGGIKLITLCFDFSVDFIWKSIFFHAFFHKVRWFRYKVGAFIKINFAFNLTWAHKGLIDLCWFFAFCYYWDIWPLQKKVNFVYFYLYNLNIFGVIWKVRRIVF